MGAIFKREFKAYFTSPVGFAILVIFYFLSGLLFGVFFQAGQPDLSEIFTPWLFIASVVIIPIITMRLFSEDKRQKTDQLLLTSPVKVSSMVMGKFLAALLVYVIAISVTIVYQLIISFYIAPDWMVFFGNYLGIFLYGAALIAVGMFISVLTESQVVAAIASFAAELILSVVPTLLNSWLTTLSTNWFVKALTSVFSGLSVLDRYSAFTQGTMNYANVLFFLSLAGVFLFLCVMVIQRRRYA